MPGYRDIRVKHDPQQEPKSRKSGSRSDTPGRQKFNLFPHIPTTRHFHTRRSHPALTSRSLPRAFFFQRIEPIVVLNREVIIAQTIEIQMEEGSQSHDLLLFLAGDCVTPHANDEKSGDTDRLSRCSNY